MKNKKIIIAIPHTGILNAFTVLSLLSLQRPAGYEISFHMVANCLVYDAREKSVEYMMKQKADYLLFLDSDMVPPSDVLVRLVSHDVDMVSGTIFKRIAPFQPCFYSHVGVTKDWKPQLASPLEFSKDKLFEVEGFGMACVLIKREAFEKIERPWFFPAPNIGEDLTFCMKAKKAGVKMYVDPRVDCGHVGNIIVTRPYYEAAYEQHKQQNAHQEMFVKEGESSE